MIALLVQNQFPDGDLTRALREEEVKFELFKWEHTLHSLSLSHNIEIVAILTPSYEIASICERIKEARLLFGDEKHLLICTPSLTEKERLVLNKCGANTIITPRTNSPEHFAERIIAELILRGIGHPAVFGLLRGATGHMRRLYSEIDTLAPRKYPVLILGETGTGKDLIAREVHHRSKRAGQFLKLNCADLSLELMRSELFGHTKGAFSGAHETKNGLMFEAGEGTLFLDEIGDLGIELQAALLQVLEDRKFRAVGANKFQDFNARLVLATNRDLEQMVEKREFRQDLLARINDFILYAPALRERRADIPLLVHHFIDTFNQENPDHQVKIPPGALDCLFQSEWSGNVRQLRKVVQKAAVFWDPDGCINVAHLKKEVSNSSHQRAHTPLNSASFDPETDTFHSAVSRMQKAYLEAQLERTRGNKEKAIEKSGIGRTRFYELLKKFEIK